MKKINLHNSKQTHPRGRYGPCVLHTTFIKAKEAVHANAPRLPPYHIQGIIILSINAASPLPPWPYTPLSRSMGDPHSPLVECKQLLKAFLFPFFYISTFFFCSSLISVSSMLPFSSQSSPFPLLSPPNSLLLQLFPSPLALSSSLFSFFSLSLSIPQFLPRPQPHLSFRLSRWHNRQDPIPDTTIINPQPTERSEGKQANRQTDSQTGGRAGGQTDKQVDRQGYK